MTFEYLALAATHILCVCTRTAYEVLKDKGIANSHSTIQFAFIFLAMCVLWVSWFAMCPSDPLAFALPPLLKWFGLLMTGMGLALAIGALVQLRGLENIDHLETRGLFSLIRHPMYAGFLAWIVGWSLYHSAPVSFVIGSITAANVLYWRRLEERRLVEQFGQRYRNYRESTWF